MLRNKVNHRIASNSKRKEEYYDQNVEIIMYTKVDMHLHFFTNIECCDKNVEIIM
jgi:hypothetical protein